MRLIYVARVARSANTPGCWAGRGARLAGAAVAASFFRPQTGQVMLAGLRSARKVSGAPIHRACASSADRATARRRREPGNEPLRDMTKIRCVCSRNDSRYRDPGGNMGLRRVVLLGCAAALLLAASVSATPLGSSGSTQTTAGTAAFPSDAAAPPFSSADLAAVPGANWITNGGNTTNDRYS